MKLRLLFSVIVLVLSFSAHAETKQHKLNELVEVMNMDSMVDQMYSQMEVMMQNMSAQMGVQPTEQHIFDSYYKEMTSVMKEDMGWEKMKPLILDVYNRNFSEQEIDDMLAFYSTETGKSLLKKMPAVMQESMQMSQILVQAALPKIEALAKGFKQELAESRSGQ